MRQRSKKCTIDGVKFDSIAEACFYCWCKEAKELGVIEWFELQPKYALTPEVKHIVEKQLKTKVKPVERTLLRASEYTADFYVYSKGLIPGLLKPQEWFSDCKNFYVNGYIVDVKGAFNKAATEFSLTQKMMWYIRAKYVNKAVVGYDTKKYSANKCATSFFALNGVPTQLPAECYKLDGGLYAIWHRMFSGLPSIKEVNNV